MPDAGPPDGRMTGLPDRVCRKPLGRMPSDFPPPGAHSPRLGFREDVARERVAREHPHVVRAREVEEFGGHRARALARLSAERRARAMAAELLDFSGTHQVLLFTCHAFTRDVFAEAEARIEHLAVK